MKLTKKLLTMIITLLCLTACSSTEKEFIEIDIDRSDIKTEQKSVELEINSIDKYKIPKYLNIYEQQPECFETNHCRVFSKACSEKYGCLADIFYPIGWSEDERYFAYIIEPADEAIGGYHFDFMIQDMVTDEIKWRWSYHFQKSNEYPEFKDYGEETMITVWETKKDLFFEKLNDYLIIQTNDFVVNSFPLEINDITYEGVIEIMKGENSSEYNFGYTFPDEHVVHLNSAKLGKKIISSVSYGEYSHIDSSYLSGALASPGEKRIAIFKINKVRGWEGPPGVLRLSVIGASSMQGFKK